MKDIRYHKVLIGEPLAYIPEDFEAKIAELSSRILDEVPKYDASSVDDRVIMLKKIIMGVADIVEAKSHAFVEIRWSMSDEQIEDIQEGNFLCPEELLAFSGEESAIVTHWVMVFDTDYPEGSQNIIHNIPASKLTGIPKIWALNGEAYCLCEDDLSNLMEKANLIPLGLKDQMEDYIKRQTRELKKYYELKGVDTQITPEILWKEFHAVGFPVIGQYEGKKVILGCVTLQGMEYWDGIHPLPDNLMRQVQRVVNMASIPIINGTIAYREKKTARKLALTLEELEKAKALIEKEKDRMQFELESAKSVQTFLLPRESPEVPGYKINGFCKPASEVGGDFFQYYTAPDGSVTFVVGDVSGKGLKAAMLVSLILGALQTLVRENPLPHQVLSSLNDIVHHEVRGQGFATCLVGRLDRHENKIQYANAGHIPPYFFDRGKTEWRELNDGPPPGFPLGIVPGFSYDPLIMEAGSEDSILLMTDGVIEAMNEERGLYGFDGLSSFLGGQSAPGCKTADLLLEDVLKFQGSAPQADDITIMTILKEV